MAGLLGEIFSAGNVAKRKLTDLLGNPVLSAQQMLGNLNDRARVLNQMTAAAAKEGVAEYGPETRKLAGLLADAYNPIGMTVYHGSPAKFSRFDPTKIGSGEGAQAYGYGHYVAQSPAVAEEYRKTLSPNELIKLGQKIEYKDMDVITAGVANDIANAKGDIAKVKDMYEKMSSQKFGGDVAKKRLEVLNTLGDNLQVQKGGNLYEIDLPDEQIARMLDWDKPFSEQPKNVQEFFANHPAVIDRLSQINAERTKLNEMYPGRLTNPKLKDIVGKETTVDSLKGSKLYEILTSGASIGKDEAARVDAMRQAGVPGIRYLDQGSRGAGEGTSNFVVFPGNEDLLTILKRNGGLLGP